MCNPYNTITGCETWYKQNLNHVVSLKRTWWRLHTRLSKDFVRHFCKKKTKISLYINGKFSLKIAKFSLQVQHFLHFPPYIATQKHGRKGHKTASPEHVSAISNTPHSSEKSSNTQSAANRSFIHFAPSLWNILPATIRESKTIWKLIFFSKYHC